MRYRIVHTTRYAYEQLVTRSYNQARLIPRSNGVQHRLDYSLTIFPPPDDYHERDDFFGNRTTYFSLQQPHDSVEVTATSEVEIEVRAPDLAFYPPITWEQTQALLAKELPRPVESLEFTLPTAVTLADEEIKTYTARSFAPGRGLVEAALDLMHRIHSDFTYDAGITDISTPLAEVMRRRAGVCQDFAHLLIACLRDLGLPTRYVSGYLETLPPPGQEKLRGVDASHAWAAVLIPGFGWLDLDPTNDQIPDSRYITTAWGRDYFDVAPLQGVLFGGGSHELTVSVDVSQAA